MPPSLLPRLAPLIANPDSPVTAEHYMTLSGASPHPAAVVALATVVEYAATAYGLETIPALLSSLNEHEGWESLVPAVFDVPVAEFEAGWHQHLAAQYGLDVGDMDLAGVE